jgi:hypothetical protein
MPLLPIYNERTDFDLDVVLVDKDGDPLVPTAIEYSIHDVESDTTVKDWTAFVIDHEGRGTIEVLAADLAIIDDESDYETRILTVSGTYGDAKEFHEAYAFRVKNLKSVPKDAE